MLNDLTNAFVDNFMKIDGNFNLEMRSTLVVKLRVGSTSVILSNMSGYNNIYALPSGSCSPSSSSSSDSISGRGNLRIAATPVN